MDFPPPPQMHFDVPNLAEAWKKWEKAYEIYSTAKELDKKPQPVQVATLLHIAGLDAQAIFETFHYPDGKSKDRYVDVLERFRAYTEPQRNIVYERYMFWKRDQLEDETIDAWVTDLKTKAIRCEFGDNEITNNMIRDKIVFGVKSEDVKMRLLREKNLKLERALEVCRVHESAKQQIKEMTQEESKHVDFVRKNTKPKRAEQFPTRDCQNNTSPCKYCGSFHPRGKCPAFGKTCNHCGKKHHFAKVCKSSSSGKQNFKPMNYIDIEDDTESFDNEGLFIGGMKSNRSQ